MGESAGKRRSHVDAALVRERVGDGRMLALVESFLRAGVLEEARSWQPTGRGTPQGGVISPRLDGRSLSEIVTGVNRSLRGWHQYFQHSKANVFAPVDGCVRRRLRSLLQKRRGRTSQGLGEAHHRWPDEWFARRGLLGLKAEHEWTRTIAGLRTH